MTARTPIERLIDAACQPVAQEAQEDLVTMECSLCGKTKRALRHETDPASAVRVVFPCRECLPSAPPDTRVQYYDAHGTRIIPSWEASG